jgi:Glycosyltransferase family 87
MKQFFIKNLQSPSVIGAVYAVSAVLIALQRFWRDDYNNFKIFKAAFWHLKANINLHNPSPSEYFDQFLYAPPAAVMFAPLHFMPTFWGIIVWVLASAMAIFYAIKRLPLGATSKVIVWWVVWLELLTSLHNQQTNSWLLVFGLLTLVFYENEKGARAAAFPILGFFIKGFGGLGGFLLFYYPKFWKNGFSYLFWIVLIGASPALFVGFDGLQQLYADWFVCLTADQNATETERHLMSLMHLINAFSPVKIPFATIQIGGLVALVLMLVYTRFFKENTLWLRLNVLAYLLMWVILFNHAAESNTHVISVGGAALWYAASNIDGVFFSNRSRLDNFLLVFVILLTCLGETDLVPRFIRDKYIFVYALKALPIFLVWCKLQWDMVGYNPNK